MLDNQLPKSKELLGGFSEPKEVYVRPIVDIHRGPDGWVTFHRKSENGLENLGSVCTAELETIFPQFAAELERDSYYSVHSFYGPAKYGRCLPGLRPALRKANAARYLNACFTDIDFHDQTGPFDFGHCFGRIITMQETKIIPPASLMMRSGRGLWLFWLLASSENPSLPPRAWPEKILAYHALESELIRRTGADPAARDIARITRVPGSINSDVFPGDPYRVMYWTQHRADGLGYLYTLESLAEFLDVELPQRCPSHRSANSQPQASARALRGWSALWQHRFDDFETLRRIRGGFRQGCRNYAAYIYGVILRHLGFMDAAVADAVTRLGRECRPPLSEAELDGAIAHSKATRYNIRDSTIADRLAVIPEEAKYIPRWGSQQARPEISIVDMNLTNTARIELRQRTIRELTDELHAVPSCREMARLLRVKRGICISHVQVSRDYARLQLNSAEPKSLLFPVSDVTLVGGEARGRGEPSHRSPAEVRDLIEQHPEEGHSLALFAHNGRIGAGDDLTGKRSRIDTCAMNSNSC